MDASQNELEVTPKYPRTEHETDNKIVLLQNHKPIQDSIFHSLITIANQVLLITFTTFYFTYNDTVILIVPTDEAVMFFLYFFI